MNQTKADELKNRLHEVKAQIRALQETEAQLLQELLDTITEYYFVFDDGKQAIETFPTLDEAQSFCRSELQGTEYKEDGYGFYKKSGNWTSRVMEIEPKPAGYAHVYDFLREWE